MKASAGRGRLFIGSYKGASVRWHEKTPRGDLPFAESR
ncbi:hypothetical protein SRB17_67170 [Streptomyces sp. RB17]|nr:hypothetical protein [Streptomyces sp. RB17]